MFCAPVPAPPAYQAPCSPYNGYLLPYALVDEAGNLLVDQAGVVLGVATVPDADIP